jgi:hypothetical protein
LENAQNHSIVSFVSGQTAREGGRRRQRRRGRRSGVCMLVPRVVQLRTHHSHSSPQLPPRSPSLRPAPVHHLLSPMASPAVDQLVADFLRKRGLTKTLKAFVPEASYVCSSPPSFPKLISGLAGSGRVVCVGSARVERFKAFWSVLCILSSSGSVCGDVRVSGFCAYRESD